MKKFEVRRLGAGRYAVYNRSVNQRESGVYSTSDSAQTRCEALNLRVEKAKATTKRKCLCCPTEFQSEGIGNRLCASCSGKVGRLGKQWANA